jgi:hypothetical protein
MAVTTKSKDILLTQELSELYDRCWNTANDSLKRVNESAAKANPSNKVDTEFLQKIKTPQEFFFGLAKGDGALNELTKALGKLNRIFADKNSLPERIVDDKKLLEFMSAYVEKNFGKGVNVVISEGGTGGGTDRANTIMLSEGVPLLNFLKEMTHEMRHMDEPFGKGLASLNTIVSPAVKTLDIPELARVFSKITGASSKDIEDELMIQNNYSYTNMVLFLIHLYDAGLYKPKDEGIRQNLESSKFYLHRDLRRAYNRYAEGRAVSAETGLLSSDDDEFRTYVALDFLVNMIVFNPQVYSEADEGLKATNARKIEGFRVYYTLQRVVGGENLRKFEEECARTNRVPGISMDWKLVVIDAKTLEMHKVDVGKLGAGVTKIEELIENEPKLPEKMD